MSRIKEHYHEQICEGIRQMENKISDDDYQCEIDKIKEENKELEELAEQAEFFKTFESTGTYPI